jgi:photosystem II stability/assembly factor-like uncharacterized protein
MLSLGLSIGLIFALISVLFAGPVAADEMKWTTMNTPSWKDNVITPGSDIYDWDVGPDGDTIYATGAISTVFQQYVGIAGLSGSFNVAGGSLTVTMVSSTVAELSGTFTGDTCYLRGDFTAILFAVAISGGGASATGEVVLTGYITDNPAVGADTMTFSGMLYGSVTSGGTPTISADIICVSDWEVKPFNLGGIDVDPVFDSYAGLFTEPRVWKSTDGGVTWDDITGTVQDAANLPGPFVDFQYGGTAVAPDDGDWLIVAGEIYYPPPNAYWPGMWGMPAVVASKDGASNFSYTGDMIDSGNSTMMGLIYDVAVAPETDDIHNIAVAGRDSTWGNGTVYRLKTGTWLTASWEDTTFYDGWDEFVSNPPSLGAVAVEFSTNFDIDDTILCMTVDYDSFPYLQCGIWETGGEWNGEAGFPNAVRITANGDALLTQPAIRSMGLALPVDYDGSDPGARVIYAYVNAYNVITDLVGGFVVRIDNSSVSEPYGPRGEPLLASIAYHGDADTGKMMVGEYIQWDNDVMESIQFDLCAGVRVWHTEELDPCCPFWELACKNPSGPYLAVVGYTPDGEKSYATTSGMVDQEWVDFAIFGGLSDESAFSVSRDDGLSWNQLSLIDTDIDWLSDVAVCPDCGTIYLSSINAQEYNHEGCLNCNCGFYICEVGETSCDSVWRSYDDGDTWERIFHGDWSESPQDQLLLRLPCDAVEDCCDQDPVSPSGTLYLGIQNSNDVFYSRDCGQCWNDPPATKIEIQDIAVESENIVYVLDDDGKVSKSTQYGRRWSDAVDTDIGSGHTISACCEEGMVVVGGAGNEPVGWSDDGGESWNLTDDLTSSADYTVHVACDPICENIIYAAISGPPGACGGIYRGDITTGTWDDLNAFKYGYYGIALGRSDGTLYAITDNIHVDPTKAICDRFMEPMVDLVVDENNHIYEVYSGVARNLTPCETACCGTEDWDYLICGLGTDCIENKNPGLHCYPTEHFDNEPSALRICGCISIDTNTVLYAIDWEDYDVTDGSDGTVWTYEDCAAKTGPTLTSPADGAVIDCEPCAGCDAANFTLKWERMCEACSYDIQIMDEDGNIIVEWADEEIVGDPPTLFVDGTMDTTEYFLECGMNYTWHVREANTLCECVHSPWSDTWTFTVAVGAADAIQLLAPTKGAMDVPIENVGFSWTSVRNATSYSFVLSPNANLAGALVSQNMSTTAFNFVGPLDYSKAYYWQIIAWQDSTRLTTSAIGVFNTMAEPVEPPPPVVVEEQPAPVINIPAAQQITPIWIYAVIGVGAALVVVVVVLIVRTRRP